MKKATKKEKDEEREAKVAALDMDYGILSQLRCDCVILCV
jgi:hypothetical protein